MISSNKKLTWIINVTLEFDQDQIMIKAQHWTRPQPFTGIVTVENLQLVEEEISVDLKPGGKHLDKQHRQI